MRLRLEQRGVSMGNPQSPVPAAWPMGEPVGKFARKSFKGAAGRFSLPQESRSQAAAPRPRLGGRCQVNAVFTVAFGQRNVHMGLIQRFKGSEGVEPALDRLGGTGWTSGKEKARKAIEKIAADLVEMYAYRKVTKGFRYDPPGELYHEFEATFGFEETPDQAKAIQDVLDDMTLVEVYPLVERALREQKMAEAFERWLEKALAGASIMVARELAPELLAAPSAQGADAKNGEDDAQNSPDEDEANAQAPAPGADYEGDAPNSGPDPNFTEDHTQKDANGAAAKSTENSHREREAAPSGARRSSRRR